jgi:uncharacterized protein (UPF0210 family)
MVFEEAGLEVQTIRLAAQPYPEVLGAAGPQGAAEYARQLEALCVDCGIDFCSIGTVPVSGPGADAAYIDAIPQVIRETDNVFASVQVAERGKGISLEAIRHAAQTIATVSTVEPSGFGNLRLAVLANCPPGSPFFPASYHGGGDTSFAVATEAADLAVESFGRARTLGEARQNLLRAVEEQASRIELVCRRLEQETGVRFGGIDFSLAPYPEVARSIGRAVENLGVDAFGSSGTLFAAAFMTRILRQAKFPKCGFCGLLFPVLEDRVLAQRSAQDLYTVDSLLLYSAVCGTGLDTVPLPGDVSADELGAILLDVATLSLVADKPLTARLMPIPGKAAGEMTEFEFAYFSNGRILDVKRRGAGGVLADAWVAW